LLVAPLGPDYIRSIRGPRASTCFHFHSELGFRRRAVSRESSSAAELRSRRLPRPRMRTKSLVLYRSKCTGFEEGKMEKAPVPDPRTN
jgi:hypothetical protein